MTQLDEDFDDDIDEQAHEELLKDLKTFGKYHKRATTPHVVRSHPNALPQLNAEKLVSKLGSILLGNSDKDFKPLLPPLEKPTEQRLKRAIGFEEVVDDVNKWESVVEQHRHADQISFPLDQSEIKMKENVIDLKPSMKTNLEKEVYALLTSSQPKPKDPDTKEVEAAKRSKALQELRLETAEVIRRRNLRLRLEKKMALLNKSKSRKYHQILRRERMRKQKENFERLRTKDPQAALEILQEIEKERITERLTLRHRNSKWVQTLQARSKHDPEARAALQENTDMRNELLKKVKDQQDQEGALQEQEELIAKGVFGEENAWLTQLARAPAPAPAPMDPEEEKSFTEMKNFWEDVNRRREAEKEAQKVVEELEKRAEQEDANLQKQVSSSPMNAEEGVERLSKATPILPFGEEDGGVVSPTEGGRKKRKAEVQDGEDLSLKVVKKGEEDVTQRQQAPPKRGKKRKGEATGSDATQERKEKKSEVIWSEQECEQKKSEAIGSNMTLKGKKKNELIMSDTTLVGKKKKSVAIGSDAAQEGKKKISETIGSEATQKGKGKSEAIGSHVSQKGKQKTVAIGVDVTQKDRKKESEVIVSDTTHKEKKKISEVIGSDIAQKGKKKISEAIGNDIPKGKRKESVAIGSNITPKGKKKNEAIWTDITTEEESEAIVSNTTQKGQKKREAIGSHVSPKGEKKSEVIGTDVTQEDKKKESEAIESNITPNCKIKISEAIGSNVTPKGKNKNEAIGTNITQEGKNKESEVIGSKVTQKGKKKSEPIGSDVAQNGKKKSEAIGVGTTQKGKKKKSKVMTNTNAPQPMDAEVSEGDESSSKAPPPKEALPGGDVAPKGQRDVSPLPKALNGEEAGRPQEATPLKVKKKKGGPVLGKGANPLLDEAFVDEMFDRAEKKMRNKVSTVILEEDDPPSGEDEPVPEKKDGFELDLAIEDSEVQINECLPGEDPAPGGNVSSALAIIEEDPSKPPSSATSVVNIRDGDVLKMNPRPMGQSAWAEITALSDNEDVDVGDSDLVQLFEDDEENLKAFKMKKEEEEEEARVKDVDMFQEGWGLWTGPGIDPVKSKKKGKYKIKAPPQEKHPYNKLGNVIYHEESDVHSNLRKLMVSQLPFPFARVKDFEASIRQSIGRQFVPEAQHRKLIEPRVVTKMGVVIPPMDKNTLVRHNEAKKKTKLEKKLDKKIKRPTLIRKWRKNKNPTKT